MSLYALSCILSNIFMFISSGMDQLIDNMTHCCTGRAVGEITLTY